MYWKKIFVLCLIFMLFLTSANALVVSDISEQINQGNEKIIENNAKIAGDVSQLKEQIKTLQQTIDVLNKDAMKKDDIKVVAGIIDHQMKLWMQQLVIMFLVLIIFSFLIFVYGKSKGVV